MKKLIMVDSGINLVLVNSRCYRGDYVKADNTKLLVEFADDLQKAISYDFETSNDAETAAILVNDLLQEFGNKKILNIESREPPRSKIFLSSLNFTIPTP